MHLLLRDLIKDTPLVKESRKRNEKKKKAQHPAGFNPTASRVLLRRRELYCCATTAAQIYCGSWWTDDKPSIVRILVEAMIPFTGNIFYFFWFSIPGVGMSKKFLRDQAKGFSLKRFDCAFFNNDHQRICEGGNLNRRLFLVGKRWRRWQRRRRRGRRRGRRRRRWQLRRRRWWGDTAFIQESNLGFHTLATYSSYLYASFVTHPFPFLKAVLNAKNAIIHPGVLFLDIKRILLPSC